MPSRLPPLRGYARAQVERCAREHAVACREAGVHLARGEGGAPRDGTTAGLLLERAWTLDRNEGCGWFFELREALPGAALERGCALRCASACEAIALQRLAHAPAEAVASLERLCDRGSAHACLTLGHLLLEGRAVPPDRRGALELIERACDLGGANACYEMAVAQWGVELHRARARELDPARRIATAPLRAPALPRTPPSGLRPDAGIVPARPRMNREGPRR